MSVIARMATLTVFLLLLACHPEPEQPGEIFHDDEPDKAVQAFRQARQAVDAARVNHVGRDAHAKAHGCARAWFSVGDDLPAALRHGVFAHAGARYQSWVRFSNGSHHYSQPDTVRDSRGIAIKLMNVPGEKLFSDGIDNDSVDWLLIDSPAFLAADAEAYLQARDSQQLRDYFFNHTINPLRWRWRELNLMRQGFRPPPANPLFIDYFGVLAYQLGPQVMKFQAQACDSHPARDVPEGATADFLGEALAGYLAEKSSCFDFRVQLQNVAAGQHVEDATEIWREQDSPWTTVARLEFPVQRVVPGEDAYCENLSFNPWRTLVEQRPLGELNRVRKSLYHGVSTYRHQENQATQAAPQAW